MTDKILRLDGVPIQQDKPLANPEITELLAELGKENDAGQLNGLVLIMVREDGGTSSRWIWPTLNTVIGVLGALDLLKDDILRDLKSRWAGVNSGGGPTGA